MINEIKKLGTMKKYLKGIILSLNGAGKGLHDEK
jgi:hypothetical protein